MEMKKEEFCIMPPDNRYSNIRYPGLERNEIFGGANRQRSIKDGLVVYLTPEQHRTGKYSFHLAPNEWIWLKKLAEETWCEYYNKTKEDFIKEYGKNYI
jgi:hypothetical protein